MRSVVCLFLLLVFASVSMPLAAQTLTSLVSFNRNDGSAPVAGVVRGADGSFYGTTYYGGAADEGTAFKITPDGNLTVLHNFCSQPVCADGAHPSARLLQSDDGIFYGTTPYSSIDNDGNLFRMTPDGNVATLLDFSNGNYNGVSTQAGVIQATDGNFYGTTDDGGSTGGTVFKATPSGNFTILYNFCSKPNCTDGATPRAALLQASDGNFVQTLYSSEPAIRKPLILKD